jgi:chloramphenicol-sensitive protein RarD
MLVLVGRFLYGDRMTWWQWSAAGIAAAGVAFEIVRVGSIGWETLLVAIGYPVYFVLRRSLGLGHLGGMWWEIAVAVPVAAVLLGLEAASGSAFAAHPALWWSAPAFGLFAAVALLLYLLASRLLPLSLFGLLSYVEPALLVVASLLIGERIAAAELPGYLAIWAAVAVLLAGGIAEALRSRRRSPG